MVYDSNQLICSNCSATLPKNVRYCTECGNKIEENIVNNQTESNPSFPSSHTKSFKKSSDQPIDDPLESLKESGKDFMRDIGDFLNKNSTSSRSRSKYCSKCSAAIPYNVNFCTECGNPVTQIPDKEIDQNSTEKGKQVNNEYDQLKYLEKLAELRDKRILSDEEFEKKKKDILKL
jgi:predicted amidophosphoribosyltransferase